MSLLDGTPDTLGQLQLIRHELDAIRVVLERGPEWLGDANQPAVKNGGDVKLVPAVTGQAIELAPENAWRRQLMIYNNSSSPLTLFYGLALDLAVFTLVLAPLTSGIGGLLIEDKYLGPVWGTWSSATGSAAVTTV